MITYAYDAIGNTINANDAAPGVEYKCPHCNIAVFKSTSQKGNAFFKRKPNTEHTTTVCKYLSSARQTHDRDNFDPNALFRYLLHDDPNLAAPPEGNEPHRGHHGGHREAGPFFTNFPVSDEDEPLPPKPFHTLKQLCDEGIYLLKPEDPLGAGTVQDIICTHCSGAFTAEHFHGGPHIFVAVPEKPRRDMNLTLIFTVFWKEGGKYKRIRLYMVFSETQKDIFFNYYKKLCPKEILPIGTTAHVPIKNNVMLAGNWEYMATEVDYATCYSCSYLNPRQIYII